MCSGRVLCVLLAVAGCARRHDAADRRPAVALVYAADLRGAVSAPPHDGGGLARRATWVDRARLTARAVVQVDAGDLAPGADDGLGLTDAAAREARARLALRAYERMGVDAMTVGERELALGAQTWRALSDAAKVPVVAANIVDREGRAVFPPTRIVRAGDLTVGLFGILELGGELQPASLGVTVTDPVAAARSAVRSLRDQGARVIVGLFHVASGLARARVIAAGTEGVDVIVLGHAGPSAPPRFVRADARGADVGRVDIRLEGPGAPVVEDHVFAASPDIPEQTGVRLLVRAAEGPIAQTFTESVAALSKAAGVRVFGERWTYGSTSLCLGCHPSQATQWMTTDHAHAYATLEAAGKEHDPACMGCHMTGFLLPGGAQNFESAAQFVDVGCEACHGPSAAHVSSMDKRKGTSRAVEAVVCLGCHTPDQISGPFSFAAALARVVGPGHGRQR